MKIRQHDWVIGSLLSADPNSQSFYSPDGRSRHKKRPSQEPAASPQDSVSIDSHTAFGSLNNSATTNVGSAISLSQTQDAFLENVQEALQRMSELSVLVQSDAKNETDRQTYSTEFTQLQSRIKDIGSKLFEAANLFQTSVTGSLMDNNPSPLEPSPASPMGNDTIKLCLANTSDPDLTGISNSKSASEAISTIDSALKLVTETRVAMSTTIQRLGEAGAQLSALSEHLTGNKKRIKDGNVAEQSTRFARYDILVQSGTAMLAQANALPQSALRLLN